MTAALLALGLQWALAWGVYSPAGELVDLGANDGFANRRACEDFVSAIAAVAPEGSEVRHKCRPMKVCPPGSTKRECGT